jgi:hypothetical protein
LGIIKLSILQITILALMLFKVPSLTLFRRKNRFPVDITSKLDLGRFTISVKPEDEVP